MGAFPGFNLPDEQFCRLLSHLEPWLGYCGNGGGNYLGEWFIAEADYANVLGNTDPLITQVNHGTEGGGIISAENCIRRLGKAH